MAKGTDALLFQDDPQFWYETVRLFGAAEYGGALFGEVIAIASKIKSGDYDSWYDANNAFADRISAEGEKTPERALWARLKQSSMDFSHEARRLLTTLQAEAANSEQTRLALENIVIGGQS